MRNEISFQPRIARPQFDERKFVFFPFFLTKKGLQLLADGEIKKVKGFSKLRRVQDSLN